MAQGVQRQWESPDDYHQAVEGAGVTELPESPRGLPPHVADGRFEDDEPPGAPR